MQKLNYIHQNPVAAEIVEQPQYFKYSSAMNYADEMHNTSYDIRNFNTLLRNNIHDLFRSNKGTRDICGSNGLTSEQFIYELSNKMNNISKK